MTLPLSKEQIEAIQARAEKATPEPWHANSLTVFDRDGHAIAKTFPHPEVSTFERDNREFISHARTDIPALCQQALRAIELEVEISALRADGATSGTKIEIDDQIFYASIKLVSAIKSLQSELTAARKALEEERERCAKAVVFCGECDCPLLSQKAIRALPSPEVKP